MKKIDPKITRSTVDTQVGLTKAGIGLETLKFKVLEMNALILVVSNILRQFWLKAYI